METIKEMRLKRLKDDICKLNARLKTEAFKLIAHVARHFANQVKVERPNGTDSQLSPAFCDKSTVFLHSRFIIDNSSTAFFAGTNFHGGHQLRDEDFSISHMAGVAGVPNCLDQFFQGSLINDDFYFDFR
ncbi:MAG: hypothetical protein ACFWUL_07205 [Dialister sp.]|jgi:hypothetical protein